MKSRWDGPPQSINNLGPEASQYFRDLHETLYGSGVGGVGRLSAHNMGIDDVGSPTRSGKPPVMVADPTSGRLYSSSAGLPPGDLDVDADGILLGVKGAGGKVATTEETSPLITHQQTSGYAANEHYPTDDTTWYDPDPLNVDPANAALGETLKVKTWSTKQIIDYVQTPQAPPTVDPTGDVSSNGNGTAPGQKLTINPKTVTRSKQADLGATKKLIGSTEAAVDAAEIAVGAGLDVVAGSLIVTSGLGGVGDVAGPAVAVDSNFAAFDTTTGKLIKDSGYSAASFATAGHTHVHSALTGLGADDHTQYHNDARALTWLGTRSTTDLAEGTNLYYTDVRTDGRISAAVGVSVQAYDSDLTAIAALATTTFGRGLLTEATAATARTTLGLGAIATAAYPSAGIPNSTGSAWGTSFAPTTGRVTFGAAGSTLDDDAALQWDDTNKYLGVMSGGSAAYPLHVYKTSTSTAATNSRGSQIEIVPSPASTSSSLFFGGGFYATTVSAQDINGTSSAGMFAGEIKALHSGTGTIQRVVGVDGKAIAGSDSGGAANNSKFDRLQNIFYASDNSARSGTATRIDGVASMAVQASTATTTYLNGVVSTPGLAAGTVTEMCGFRVWEKALTSDADVMTGGTITNYFGLKLDDPTSGPTYTNVPEAIRIESYTPAGSIGVRQRSTSMTNRFAGNTRIGADTAPTVALDVTGAALISTTLGVTGAVTLTNKVTTYNNVATVERGIPSVVASVTSAATNAAVGATTLYATPATGFYRVTVQLSQTVAATTSAVLGPVTISWTDGNNSSAQSIDPQCTTLDAAGASTSATSSLRNTPTTKLHGSIVIYALIGTNIQHTIGYTSVGATAMVYRYRLLVEAL